MASQFYSFWLVIGVVFVLYLLWGPILEASRKNSNLRRFPFSAIFEGQVTHISTRERIEIRHEQANKDGALEYVENRRTWMILELSDEDGYLGKVRFPMDKRHNVISNGRIIRTLVFSDRKYFSNNIAFDTSVLFLL